MITSPRLAYVHGLRADFTYVLGHEGALMASLSRLRRP